MKKTKQLIFASILAVCSFTCVVVSANEYDFYETVTVTDMKTAEEKLAEQVEHAEKFSTSLDNCTYLEYSGDIFSKKEFLDTVTVETLEEKETELAKYRESDGYTTSVTVTYDEGVKTEYEFEVLNGKVTSTTIDNISANKYNGYTIKDVLSTITTKEEDDYKIVVSTKGETSTPVSGTITTKTEKEVQDLVTSLQKQGYTNVKYTPNNKVTMSKKVVSRNPLTDNEIKGQLESENSGKEIKNVSTTTVSTPNIANFNNLSQTDADSKKTELENTGLYELVVKNEKINENDATKVKEKQEYTGSNKPTIPYTEDIEEINSLTNTLEKVGHRDYYYGDPVIDTPADYKLEQFLTKEQCDALYEQYTALGYEAECEPVVKTGIAESSDDTYRFNDTKQETRTWSHLDLSVSQSIIFYSSDGTVYATVDGELSNVNAYFYKNGKKIDLVYSSNSSSDGGRLEYCQTNSTDGHCGRYNGSSSVTSITNEDEITITATIKYTLNDTDYSADITLVGYLNNIFNVCRQKDDEGGGFDLKLAIAVDEHGHHVVNFTTEQVWTFTASKEATYKTPVYYDEYRYGKLYDIVAQDLDYIYNVNYLATDYTVSYEGTSSVYNLIAENFDKNFIIDGSRTTYTVTTTGNIKEDKMCGVGDIGEPGDNFEEEIPEEIPEEVPEEILPPHTGVEASIQLSPAVMNNLYFIPEDKKRKR